MHHSEVGNLQPDLMSGQHAMWKRFNFSCLAPLKCTKSTCHDVLTIAELPLLFGTAIRNWRLPRGLKQGAYSPFQEHALVVRLHIGGRLVQLRQWVLLDIYWAFKE